MVVQIVHPWDCMVNKFMPFHFIKRALLTSFDGNRIKYRQVVLPGITCFSIFDKFQEVRIMISTKQHASEQLLSQLIFDISNMYPSVEADMLRT